MSDVMVNEGFAAAIDRALRCEAGGDAHAAIAILGQVLENRPNHRDALLHLGRLAGQVRNKEGALAIFRAILAANPDDVGAWRLMGRSLVTLGDWPRAEECHRACVRLEPHSRASWFDLAESLEFQGRVSEAADVLKTCRQLFPEDPFPQLRLAHLYRNRNLVGMAADICETLTKSHPDNAEVWAGVAVTHHIQGRSGDADACFRRALALEPDNVSTHFAWAFHLMATGRWEEGFEEFGWCDKLGHADPRIEAMPEWTGAEPAGSRIIVWNRQGYGDAIQFLRYVGFLAERGYVPVLVLPKQLARLSTTIPGAAEVHLAGQDVPEATAQIALHNMPRRLGVCRPEDTWRGSYLTAPGTPELPKREGKFSVGLVWAGRPDFTNDFNRSIPPSALTPLLDVPGVQWFGLQVGPRRTETAGTAWVDVLEDLSPLIADFADTAALMARMDLIISVDTSTAHLAGALGKRTWLMLPKRCDWRWTQSGDRTGWYPSVKIFRQPTFGYWAPSVAAMAEELTALVGELQT